MKNKDLIQLGITVVLIFVLILALGNARNKAALRKNNILPKVENLSKTPVVLPKAIDSKSLYITLENQAKSIELKRDPFTAAPILAEKTLQSGVDLTGIIWDKEKPLAIIDGEIVKKGALIGNKTIIEIKKDRVILSDGQILTELKLDR